MPTALRSIYVDAPVEQVREYLRTPASVVEWWPDCDEVHDVEQRSDGHVGFKWTDKPAGVVCHGETDETAQGSGEDILMRLSGDLCGDMSWRVQGENGGALVTFRSDYDLPVRSLIPYLSPVRLLRFQQDEADAIAAKIRAKFQGM
jgi:hypothetical protein